MASLWDMYDSDNVRKLSKSQEKKLSGVLTTFEDSRQVNTRSAHATCSYLSFTGHEMIHLKYVTVLMSTRARLVITEQ